KILIPCCLLLALAAAAPAQQAPSAAAVQSWAAGAGHGTPDGVPPSGETICNGLTGAAHGLCTAYCEAMDCDSDAPQASAKACGKVKTNFEQITGGVLPCDCPCVTQYPGFLDALNSVTSQDSCFEGAFLGVDAALVTTASGFNPIGAVFPDGS